MGRSPSWDTLQDRLRSSILSITSHTALPFDTDDSGTSFATGFVVDAEQGIVLSNRHVMGPGPSYHQGTFFDNQEVALQPMYYDPEHDFSFFRYDPSELKGPAPKAIRLAPWKARSGLEVRLIGNDSGEKMSVFWGELSQLDRNAPDYSSPNSCAYSDFNTFYYQASTSSKGGSSGSPVVDVEGDAVALNAGGKVHSSSSYFLPLERVQYALEYILRGEIPPRGTMQAVFQHITYTQAGRLGLEQSAAAQQGACIEGPTGYLTVHKVLSEGPADGRLVAGDIVITVNGAPAHTFPDLARTVDASAGSSVSLCVFRSGEFATVNVDVQDLYAITPTALLKVGQSYFSDLSFQFAVCSSTSLAGVNVFSRGNGFISPSQLNGRSVIHAVNNQPTPNLQALMDVLRDVRRGEQMVVHAKSHTDPRDEAVFVTSCPMADLPALLYTRSVATGFWSIEPFAGLAMPEGTDRPGSLPRVAGSEVDALCKEMSEAAVSSTDVVSGVRNSIVYIVAQAICPADGHGNNQRDGGGFVVDKRRGLVLCSTAVVSNPTSNITIIFGGTVRVHATLAYVHPLYPIAFIKYDPALLCDGLGPAIAVHDMPLTGGTGANRLTIGESVTMVNAACSGIAEVHEAVVSYRYLISTASCDACYSQRFFNIDSFELSLGSAAAGIKIGAVCGKDGGVRGLWIKTPRCTHGENQTHGVPYIGVDISLVLPSLDRLRVSDTPPDAIRVLDVEFCRVEFSNAVALGVDPSHMRSVVQAAPTARSFLSVEKVLSVRPAGLASLEVGDIILRIDNKVVYWIDDIACFYDRESVDLTIVRRGKEIVLSVPTSQVAGSNTRRVVFWAGWYLQEPYQQVFQVASRVASQVFSFVWEFGAPTAIDASIFDMFVTDIGSDAIQTLDDVVRAARRLKSSDRAAFNDRVAKNERMPGGTMPGSNTKIHVVQLNGEDVIESVRTNDHYFPAWQLVRGPRIDDEWVWEEL
ncbi:hypothetical protein H4R18_000369 [Coemansia javaensis]|uniref:PDZ domain-containing protein n=1 Tax=Coemansia javaensis TaxID=2761396 RepID=A0A9W8HIG8_9FUNG|nr:hypothetical protein H4R18_000369 [Coemansia javaensis]